MADTNPTPLNIETLNALGARLFDHAEDVAANIEFEPLVLDLKLAARACDRLAGLRFQVAEIAADVLTIAGTRYPPRSVRGPRRSGEGRVMRMSLGTLAMSLLCAGATVALLGGTASDVLLGQIAWLIVFFSATAIIDVYVERRSV
jgi:hypothetical protein